jgi:hypothetical protein
VFFLRYRKYASILLASSIGYSALQRPLYDAIFITREKPPAEALVLLLAVGKLFLAGNIYALLFAPVRSFPAVHPVPHETVAAIEQSLRKAAKYVLLYLVLPLLISVVADVIVR